MRISKTQPTNHMQTMCAMAAAVQDNFLSASHQAVKPETQLQRHDTPRQISTALAISRVCCMLDATRYEGTFASPG
jgi:hypothetical protein